MRHVVLPLNPTLSFAVSRRSDKLTRTPWFLHPARGLPMPAPTPLPLRQAIVRRHQPGRPATPPPRTRPGPARPTLSGRSMPRNASVSARASVSVGCASSMSVAAPSCGRSFFPQGKWLKVPPADVQAELRRAFARWGRPAMLRVDNGGPWGSAGDWPPELALWLIGLGLEVPWNDAHTPQQNGV